uniref:MGS-like domain-containing protein n=1 Tax=Desulfatirhabdium butyrativorans TaxID=340467 RepID=A0A7C4MKA2_9BACT
MQLNIVDRIDRLVKVRNVLISVSDKEGLIPFVTRMLDIQPGITIFSTGGTYDAIRSFLGAADDHLRQVSEYTGQPETQGGLVKTLDFKIYLGLLTETYNPAHQKDLERTHAVPIDMVVVNLYPFEKTIRKQDITVEQARGNIDIGGPCMIRAAAKNFIRVASVVDPNDYDTILDEIERFGGSTSIDLRFRLAQKAFRHTAQYDRAIADYLAEQTIDRVSGCYKLL